VTATYGVAQAIAQNVVATVAQNYQLSGETLKAQRLNTSYSNITQNVSLGLGIGITALTGNPLGIAMSAFQLAQRAYQLSLATQRYAVERAKDQYRSQYLSQRLVRNISEVR
jgi:ABC-type nitrate/sulfonate/bicarbonate transport system permease component